MITRDPWRLAIRNRTPMLLIGSNAATTEFLTEIDPWLIEPVVHVGCRSHMELPKTDATGTVILYDVHWLGESGQRQLLEWLNNDHNQTLVISTSACRLIPLVRANQFLDTLYERLNTFYVDVEPVSD